MAYVLELNAFSNNSKDGTIKERDLTIEGLKSEISRLTAMLSMFKNQKEIYEFQIKVNIYNSFNIVYIFLFLALAR